MKSADDRLEFNYYIEDVHAHAGDAPFKRATEVQLMGERVAADVEACEITLVNADDTYGHSPVTIRLIGPQLAAAVAAGFRSGRGCRMILVPHDEPAAATRGLVTHNPIPQPLGAVEGEPFPGGNPNPSAVTEEEAARVAAAYQAESALALARAREEG